MTEQVRWLDRLKSWIHFLPDLTLAESQLIHAINLFMGHDGVLYPSVATFSEVTGLDRRTVQRGLRKLVERGVLVVVERAESRFPTTYRFAPLAASGAGAKPRKASVQSRRKKESGAAPVPPLGAAPESQVGAAPVPPKHTTQEHTTEHTTPEAPPARVAPAPVQTPASPEAIFAKLEAIGHVRNPFAAKVAIKTFLRAGGEPDDFRVLASASALRTREGFPRHGSRRVGLLVTWMNEEHRWRPQVCETRRAWETRAYRKRQAEEASRWWLSKASVPKGAQELVLELMRGVR